MSKSGVEKPVDDNINDDNSNKSKSGVGEPINDSALNLGVSDKDESVNEIEEATKPSRNGIDFNLDGLY